MIEIWLILCAVTCVFILSVFTFCVVRRRWTWAALCVGVVNLLIGVLNFCAPSRGALDENYLGYQFGLLSASKGISVTIIAGITLLCAVAAACLSVWNRKGKAMLFVAVVDALLFINFVASFFIEAFTTNSFAIQLGEFLTIPSAVGFAIQLCIFAIPLGAASIWAVRRWHFDSHSTQVY